MKTYQDLELVLGDEQKLMSFVRSVIDEHKNTDLYKIAVLADEYDRQQNTTICQYQKLLYMVTGETVPDNYSANFKLCSNFFNRLVSQRCQHILGNGIVWQEQSTKNRLGKTFDTRVQEIGHEAIASGVAFGFWNYDHLEFFSLREFVPLYDEETGALRAGVRFWQIDTTKPLRATLYTIDGITEYAWNRRNAKGKGEILSTSKYTNIIKSSDVDGEEIIDGNNYPSFPIVPMFGNRHKQSALVGMRENIDCFDLIKSGYANTVDDASLIYWTLNNAGGMDEIDLAKFLDQMRRVKAAVVDDAGATAEAHTMDIPYAGREAILTRLRADIYEDFMALDTKNIANGATTATQIQAAYEPLNTTGDQFTYCVIDFLQKVLVLVGIDDEPTFSPSMIVNRQEEINIILQSAQYLSQEYVTKKILSILGDSDAYEDVIRQMDEENINRYPDTQEEGDSTWTEGTSTQTETSDGLSQS